jgi:mannosyltransferase
MMRNEQQNRLRHGGWLAAILLLGLVVRVPYLSSRSIWFDEASSWQTASFPLTEIPESLRFNVHMPMYYYLLKAWMTVAGDSVLALRGFSVLWGLVTIAGMFQFSRALYALTAAGAAAMERDGSIEASADRFGLLVAAVTALSAFQVSASIEARMYSLGTAWAAWGSWLLLRCVRQSGLTCFGEGMSTEVAAKWPNAASWSAWGWYGAASTGFLYSHHFAVLTLAAQSLFLAGLVAVAWTSGERSLARRTGLSATLTLAGVSVAYVPGLLLLLHQFGRVRREYWIEPMGWWTVPNTLFHFVLPLDHAFDNRIRVGVVLAGVLALLLVGLLLMRAREGEWLLVLLMLFPLLAVAAVSWQTPIWEARYFRFAQLSWLVAAVLTVERMLPDHGIWRGLGNAVVVLVSLVSTVAFWVVREIPGRPGMRGAISEIADRRRAGEPIVTIDNLHYFPAKYHASQETRIGSSNVRLLPPQTTMMWGWHLIRKSDLIGVEELRRGDLDGIWLIGRPPSTVTTLLDELDFRNDHFARFEFDYGSPQWTVDVYCYRRHPKERV